MVSILKRTVFLSFSRFANQAVVLISPLVLVRILPVSEYGSYREFQLYALLIVTLAGFSIPRSLTYLVPKHPERGSAWITQTLLFTLSTSTAAVILLYILGDLLRANTSFDFVSTLQLYVIFMVNVDFLEFYWLGKKRTDYVLYYSAMHLIGRLVVVITAAILSQDAHVIVTSLTALEGLRFVLVLLYAAKQSWFSFSVSRKSLSLQTSYFLPLGMGSAIEMLNARAGMLLVSALMGSEALAFYVIGTFATPIVNTLRGAIADVIFPDIVEARSANLKDALPLWRRATIWYCVLLFPTGVLFASYADAVVNILFTDEYAAAIPIFSIFAMMLFLHCFDFHLPLRVQNANRFFVIGSVIALIVNLSLVYPLYSLFGLMGPALAFVISRVAMTAYLAAYMGKIYTIRVRDMLNWTEISKIFVASVVCLPILVAGRYAVESLVVRGFIFGSAYFLTFLLIIRFLGIWDAFGMIRSFSRGKGAADGKA